MGEDEGEDEGEGVGAGRGGAGQGYRDGGMGGCLPLEYIALQPCA